MVLLTDTDTNIINLRSYVKHVWYVFSLIFSLRIQAYAANLVGVFLTLIFIA